MLYSAFSNIQCFDQQTRLIKNNKIEIMKQQFVINITPTYSAQECHFQGVYDHNGSQDQNFKTTVKIGPRPLLFWVFEITHKYTRTSGRTRTHAHTHTHITGRTPLNKWSASRRGRCLHNAQQIKEKNTYALTGIQTRDPSSQAATTISLGNRGHWD